jgi:hypothetical protein
VTITICTAILAVTCLIAWFRYLKSCDRALDHRPGDPAVLDHLATAAKAFPFRLRPWSPGDPVPKPAAAAGKLGQLPRRSAGRSGGTTTGASGQAGRVPESDFETV